MQACNSRNIYEKAIPIPIKRVLSTSSTSSENSDNEYSLKQNFFDPTKSSPPNDFMKKLKNRMAVYESHFINLDNDDNE